MNRKEFINQAGKGAAFALFFGCMSACKKKEKDKGIQAPVPEIVDFTIDVTAPEYANLQDVEVGWVDVGKVVVAKKSDGTYIAATKNCTHEGYYTPIIEYYPYNSTTQQPLDHFFCSEHSGEFLSDGTGIAGTTVDGTTLYLYNTTLTGNMLRVYS